MTAKDDAERQRLLKRLAQQQQTQKDDGDPIGESQTQCRLLVRSCPYGRQPKPVKSWVTVR
jgi:hypothetical protein